LDERKAIAQRRYKILGDWVSGDGGRGCYAPCECPNKHLHSDQGAQINRRRGCRVYVDENALLHCHHSHCQVANREQTEKFRQELATLDGCLEPSPEQINKIEAGQQRTREEHEWRQAAAAAWSKLLAEYRWAADDSPSQILPAQNQAKQLLGLFERDDIVWIGDKFDSGRPEHANRFRPVSQWLQVDGVPPFNFTCPSTFQAGTCSRNNVAVQSRRFIVFEYDPPAGEDLDEARAKALSVFSWCRNFLVLRAVVDSANKSLHGWFDWPDDSRIVRQLIAFLEAWGFDPSIIVSPSQPCRLPGAIRKDKTGKMKIGADGQPCWQRLLWLDEHPTRRLRCILPTEALNLSPCAVEVVPDELKELEAVYTPPSWDEVTAAIAGSPLATYLEECRQVGDIPKTFSLVDAILFGCLSLTKHDRRIGVENDHAPRRCNAYAMHLGPSGTGKGFSSDILLHLCERADIYRLGGRSAAYLAHRCNETDKVPFHARFGLYRISEVKSILSPKDPVGSGLATTFLQAYDEGIMEWSTAPNGKPRTVLIDPFAPSLLLEGQPDLIESSVGSTNLDAGFLARFLVASSRSDQRAKKLRGFNADKVLAAYSEIGRGPRIIRPGLPESVRLDHCLLDGAVRSAWSRLHGDYLPRFAALLDPAGTAKGRLDASALDRALILAEFFLGESVQLLGLVHGDRLAMLVARFERFVSKFPGSTDRDLYRSLTIDSRTFKIVSDTAIARESVRYDHEKTGHHRRRWYPTTVSHNCQGQPTDTNLQAGIIKTLSAVNHSTTHLTLNKGKTDGGGYILTALTAEVLDNQPQKCQTPAADTDTDSDSDSGNTGNGGAPVPAPEPPTQAPPPMSGPIPAVPVPDTDAQAPEQLTANGSTGLTGTIVPGPMPPSPELPTLPDGNDPVSRCQALFPGKKVWVYDCETYPDFFLAVFTNGHETVEFDDSQLNDLRQFVTDPDKVLVGFNSYRFDDVLLKFILTDPQADARRICNRVEAIINYKQLLADNPKRKAIKELTYKTAIRWHRSIDLAQHLAKGETDSFAGLKVYATRLRMPDIVGLPYRPGVPLGDEAKKQTVREYCRTDLKVTLGLLERGLKLIEMRVKLENDYGVNVLCASEARIAEDVMAKLFGDATGAAPFDLRQIAKPSYPSGIPMAELLPVVKFQTPELQAFHDLLKGLVVTAAGDIRIGDELEKRLEIEFGGHTYTFALGGLHSVDKRAVYHGDADHKLIDLDVASYYPSILVKRNLYPAHLSPAWSQALGRLMHQRLEAKRAGDKATADSLKIVINATFGKCGDRFSWMYDPRTKYLVTVGGQMQILALIEAVTLAGAEVVSANTDGITVRCPVAAEPALLAATRQWEMTTGFELERADYRLYARRDVNNYVAVTLAGKVKTKGAFSDNWQDLGRKHDANIIAKAVINFYRDGIPVEQTVNQCQDLYEFLRTYRRSHLRSKITWRGAEIQDYVRWYVSVAGDPLEVHSLDGRKSTLADGGKAMICNRITDTTVPADLDRQHYIAEAHAIIDPPRAKSKKPKNKSGEQSL